MKQFLVFKKNIVKSYLYDWNEGIRLSRSGGRVGIDLVDPTDPRAVEFRKLSQLDSALHGSVTEFEKIVRILEMGPFKNVAPRAVAAPRERRYQKMALPSWSTAGTTPSCFVAKPPTSMCKL